MIVVGETAGAQPPARADASAPPLVLYSATDLTNAAHCEFALLRRLDAKLGRLDGVPELVDEMLERAARLGDAHELRTLEAYRARFGPYERGCAGGVAEIERPDRSTPETLAAAQQLTVEALRSGAEVVFQATFFDGRFLGFADFLVRAGDSLRYEVYDTKLARRAKVTALLQLAAYADQLARLDIPVGDEVHLLLGDGSTSTHHLRDILPVYLDRRAQLENMFDTHAAGGSAAPPVAWGDPRYRACGRCEVCEPEVETHRDLLLVGGLRSTQRARLRAAGIESIDALAALPADAVVPGVPGPTLGALRDQARMQTGEGGRAYRVFRPQSLAALPEPDPGDVFFDFEGDPLYTEGAGRVWGLDYLFGVLEHAPTARETDAGEGSDGAGGRPPLDAGTVFRPFWAHSFAEEKAALVAFLDHVTERLRTHPGLHIYHYADYERAHLQALCARYGVGEQQLDELLRRNVFVDLYPLVKRSVRVATRSYSLKKLEPLYMGELLRDSEVTTGAGSITAYVTYTELRAAAEGGDAAAGVEAAALLESIGEYNEYDCLSTLRLRDWLLARAAENGVTPDPAPVSPDPVAADDPAAEPTSAAFAAAGFELSTLHRTLLRWHDELGPADAERSADQHALALAGAAIDYHRREVRSFWWEHYNRLEQPIEEWADTRDVLVVTTARIADDWRIEPGRRSERRQIDLRGVLAPGSRFEPGASGRFFVYDPPHPWSDPRSRASARLAHDRTRLEAVELPTAPALGGGAAPQVAGDPSGGEATIYRFTEALKVDGEPYRALPVAVVPAAPPRTAVLEAAITEWGQALAAAHPRFPADPAVDLLRRRPPRRRDGAGLAPVGPGEHGTIDAIRESLLGLDDSSLAVQGPPGTGKTYTGARVVADLVRRHGWRIGVVAQSHAVVENMLTAVVGAGAPAEAVGKAGAAPDAAFTALSGRDALARFLADSHRAGTGVVVGGTAWDFANPTRVARRELDLLVIDEAGQFSLANTIAVSVAARRLLLLGDPQQLPQVTQGTHPEPVDTSALGWLSAGHDVLPAELGYFLAESWRMHPAVCAPVSELSYEGALHAKLPQTLARRLEGVDPGLQRRPVAHQGNSTSSPAEAAEVVAIVRSVLGRPWFDPAEAAPAEAAAEADSAEAGSSASAHADATSTQAGARPLTQADVIVVAPYNAQVELVRLALAEAGLTEVPVGTVDRFQGREAAVAVVTLAASSALEVPRGIGFLLMKNRLNVALSRAKWAAYLVHSPALAEHLPYAAEDLAALSAFLRLSRASPSAPAPAG